MNLHTLRICLIFSLAALPFCALAQERVLCDGLTIHAADSACQRLQAIHKKYRSSVSLAEHQALYNTLLNFRNSSEVSASATQIIGENSIDQALMLWLDWYQVALVAREENQQLLETEPWRIVLGLAHRDPYAALQRLHTAGKTQDEHNSALRLLLAGMLTNNLRVLAEAAHAHPNHDDQENRVQSYVDAHTQDFNIGETCYGANYNGRHFSAVEKRYPSSNYAQAAAYLAMTITPCGECEGDFSCYLSNRLRPTQEYLSKYPTSNYVPMLLKRMQNAIPLALGEKEAQADYLSVSDKYVPLDAANVLLRFEGYLKNLAPADQISIKVTLADLYIKLNQAGNARRIIDWLATQAADTPDLVRLKLALSNMKKFALTLQKPKPYGPNMLVLEWSVRNAAGAPPMQLWRSETPEFSQAIPIGAVLPKGSLKVVDTTVQSDTAYWYRLETMGENRTALSHTAFAQTWSSQAHLQEIIFDQASKTLFAIGRLPENYVSRVLLRFPKNLSPKEGDIKNLQPLFASPMKRDTWLADRDSSTILMADTAGVIASTLNLDASNKTGSSGSAPDQGVTIDRLKKQVLRVNGGLSARSQDGKFVYVWDRKGKLLKTDFSGKILEVIFEEATSAMPWKDKLKAFYLFVRRNGEVFLVGQKQTPLAGTLFTLRKLSSAGYTDVDVAGRPSYSISSPNVWLYDSGQDGLWFADYDGRPSLFGLDGKLLKTVPTKLDNGSSFVNAVSLALDSDSGELYVASSTQVIKVNRLGKTDLIWEKIETQPGGQLLQAKLIRDREKSLEQDYASKKCELDQAWLGQAAIACQDRR